MISTVWCMAANTHLKLVDRVYSVVTAFELSVF